MTHLPHHRVTRILDEDGDALVRSYVAEHRADCAVRILSWRFLFCSLPIIAFAAALGSAYWGPAPPAPSWVQPGSLAWFLNSSFGHFWGVLCGATVAALLLAVFGSLLPQVIAPESIVDPSPASATAPPGLLRSLGYYGQPKRQWLFALCCGYRGQPLVQEPWYALLLLLMVYVMLYDALVAISLLTSLIASVYLFVMGFRLLALLCGGRPQRIQITEPPESWPMYTILVPLYHEESVASTILAHLQALDYPHDRLDVKFLLEADDPETLAVLHREGLPDWCEILIVPDAQPKTKPRACNHGLARARGEYLVIFDAEDRPEPDQLKKAVCAFAQQPERVVCLQAQLAYHNHRQNFLTRCFAIEYNLWFQRYLCGLHRLGGPLPLGGTSNHFRCAALRKLDGWDPFNVTEDCDLGVRLHVAGYRTATLDSVTWEEANSRVGNWLRQRSRWLKGYLVTHIVWSRRPLYLLSRLGPLGFLRYLASIIGIAGLAIINLPVWIMLGIYSGSLLRDSLYGWSLVDLLATPPIPGEDRWSWPLLYIPGQRGGFWAGLSEFLGIEAALPPQDLFWSVLSLIFALATLLLLAANLLFVLMNMLYGHRPGQRGLIVSALLTPVYWLLISLAAWKALWQLCLNPHKWEKTLHGLDHSDDTSSTASQSCDE